MFVILIFIMDYTFGELAFLGAIHVKENITKRYPVTVVASRQTNEKHHQIAALAIVSVPYPWALLVQNG